MPYSAAMWRHRWLGFVHTGLLMQRLPVYHKSVHTGGKLATLDQRLPVQATQGGSDTLELITSG